MAYMEYSEIRKFLKENGVSEADTLTERQLSSYRSMTRGTTDPDLLKKKIKDWRKTLYRSAQGKR